MSDDLPTVSNSVEDASGQVVQVGVHHGDIHVHTPQRPAELPLRTGLIPLRAASFQERADLISDGVTVLFGMGGVGKTQLAADHAERRWEAGDVQLLVWVTASSREAIVSAYADAAAKLTGHVTPDPEQGAQTLLEQLATTAASWMVVLDDLQTPADLTRLWPPASPNGQVVVTTRRRDSALRGHRRNLVEVDVFDEPEALAYVKTVLTDEPRLLDDAEGLVRDLGRLPVALAQAGAYLVDKHLSCSEYRARFAERRLANVVPDGDGLPDEHQTTVAATWSLSVELANRLAPEGVARPLLEIASVLDHNGIPASVFTAGVTLELLSETAGRPVDESDARDGLSCLHRLSLVTLDLSSAPHDIRVHTLVQRATRDAWPDERTGSIVRTAATAVHQVWPEVERDTVLSQALRSSVDALATVGQSQLWQPRCHKVLLRAGRSRADAGLAAGATDYFGSLRDTATRLLGSDHRDTLTLRHNHSSTRADAGDLEGAMAAFEELLADKIRVLGPDDPSTLITRSNLAQVRGEAGDHAGAVVAFQALLADRLRILGPDDPSTLRTRSNLATAQGKAGDNTAAVAALQDLLADRLRILGADHPDTLMTRNNLARRRGAAGDAAGEMAALEELLVDQLRVLGPDHPDTLVTRNNLATAQTDVGKYEVAVAALREVLADRLRILGPDHPETLLSRNNLAYAQTRIGDHEAAAAGYREVLADRLRVLGSDHPSTLITRGNLATLQGEAGDVEEAVATFKELLADQRRIHGPDHPDTRLTGNNLDYWKWRLDEAGT
ncbi:FxSxx-COOH system tetratricopeptide repeat protein [Lentzea sp. NBC_00516]|uniref:FxSxx-COOH system tetratricopeptide repeat protein n=1 Tax=Lentzea sp. NBC_00516 TaxID=2903582 RepID=UPI002E80C32E|nr:FxSxx-COOH system tetratricopeptide repeat protein [Lentzea sp. NBC_00516]WUD25282.1 FxSxx-COOH system tetratricopeptide repeat protein [Lentzea sp. NBC_00516]